MKGYKNFGGSYIDDLGQYMRDYIRKYKDSPNKVRIYVGCDSEQYRNCTRYATVIMLYHQGAGAHLVFEIEKVQKVRDMYLKLWGEVTRAFQLAEYLEKELEGVYERIDSREKLVDVDLDLNPDPRWKSHIAYDAGMGFMKANGYRVRGKPFSYSASCAADLVCRKKKQKRKNF